MHCHLHDRMGDMRAHRLGSPPSLVLARHGIAAINASGYPKLFIVMKWVKPAFTEGAATQNGIVYLRSIVDGETRLLVEKGDSGVLVKGWNEGELGVTLGAGTPLAPPPALLPGTATGDYLNDIDTSSRKVEGQAGKDMIWGAITVDQLYSGDGDDWILGNLGADYLHEIDSGYALASGVYLSGEASNDNEWRIAV